VNRQLVLSLALFATGAAAQTAPTPWPTFLSPEARAGLAANDARGADPTTLSERRARAEAIQREIGMPRLNRYKVVMKEDVIAGVPVRVFTPASERAGGPVLLNLHGGGFLVDSGSITENAAVAGLTGYRVVAVRYRLSPENPFPAAVDDAERVYRALLRDRPSRRIGVYGTSAGAILSAQLVARLRETRVALPAALGFFSGTADLSANGDTIARFANPAVADAVAAMYAGKRNRADVALSPARGNLAGWPPTLCIASGRDFLLSATTEFCRRLDVAEVPAKLIVYDGLPHAFWSYIDAPETDAAFAAMARFFRARLRGIR